MFLVRWFFTILMLIVMGSYATGILQTLHMMEHEREDAAADAVALVTAGNSQTPSPDAPKHHHSEEGCPICAAFHAPVDSSSQVTLLIDTGTWVPFISMLAVSQQSQTFPFRISCRGPPAGASC